MPRMFVTAVLKPRRSSPISSSVFASSVT